MNKKLKVLISLVSGLTLLSVLTACSSTENNNLEAIPTLISPVQEEIKTEKVIRGTLEKIGEIRGKITPVAKMDMYFKNKGGYLTKFNIKAGDTIKKGDVIAELDDSDIRFSIKQQDIKLKLAQLAYDQAVKNQSSDYEIQRAGLLLESEKLQMEQLNSSLKKCILTADMSGKVIYAADVKLAQFINSFQTLVTIADPNTQQIQCEGTNTNFGVGNKVSIKLINSTLEGEVVSNTAQLKSGDQEVKKGPDIIVIKFSDPAKSTNIGDNVTVSCTVEKKENILLVPKKAVKYGAGDHPFVQIPVKGDVLDRYIETGLDDGNNVEVLSGLSEGEEVITN